MDTRPWLASLRTTFEDLVPTVTAYVPRVATALMLVGIGWLVALSVRALLRQVVRRVETLVRRRIRSEETREQRAASRLLGGVAFWLVFLFFVAAATDQLGLPVVTAAIAGLANYLPAALGAIVILFAASLVAEASKRAVIATARASGLSAAQALGSGVKITILAVAVVVALDQLGINSAVLIALTAVVAGCLAGGAALAFALGARTTVSNILTAHYLKQTYRPGQTIRIEDISGRIVEIRPSGVVLDSSDGQVVVPAGRFNDSISFLVEEQVA